MIPPPLPRAGRRALAAALAALSIAACDDPAEVAKEVVEARGDCDQDSLKASSEACVQMFERYGAMATEAIHAYIGGMKAMDQALDRMPPANFDTAGLGHAITLPLETAPDGLAPTAPYDASLLRRDPLAPPYDEGWAEDAGWGATTASPSPAPAPQRGVLRPPAERLDRPWLRPRADEYEDEYGEQDPEPLEGPVYRDPAYDDPAYDARALDDPRYEPPRSRPSPRKQ